MTVAHLVAEARAAGVAVHLGEFGGAIVAGPDRLTWVHRLGPHKLEVQALLRLEIAHRTLAALARALGFPWPDAMPLPPDDALATAVEALAPIPRPFLPLQRLAELHRGKEAEP